MAPNYLRASARGAEPPRAVASGPVHLFLLVTVPFVAGAIGFFLGKRRITPLEAAFQIGFVVSLMVAGYHLTRWAGVQDYEIWNGRVASKDSGTGGCCHSYECNCRQECTTDSEGNSSCSEVCDTCYEHSYDEWYQATSTNGERVYYAGCYAPGTGSPWSWDAIRVGEPTAWEHRYTNYVMADPDEVIAHDPALARFDGSLPDYPEVIGFRAKRFVFVGIPHPDPHLDTALAELNADLGAPKQVNVVVVVVAEADPAWFDALVAAWLGGKKNDVVLVVGAPAFPGIAWARVMAWNLSAGAEDEFRGSLEHRVQTLGTFDGDAILAIVRDEVTRNYRRRPFAEFRYLMARARPSLRSMVILFAVGLLVSGVLQWIFWRNRRRMTGAAPHERVRRAWNRLRDRAGR